MKLLLAQSIAPTGALGQGPAWQEARRAYALGMVGLHIRSRRRLDRLLARLSAESAGGQLTGFARGLAGLVARAACDWEAAATALGRASVELSTAGDGHGAVLLALWVEALCASGLQEKAAEAISSWREKTFNPPGNPQDLASAIVRVGVGDLLEGLQLASSAAQGPLPVLGKRWAQLLRAEALVDLSRHEEAAGALTQLLGELDSSGDFDELYARALTLHARLKVEQLWVTPSTTQKTMELARAVNALRVAQSNTVAFPRYHPVVEALRSQLDRVRAPAHQDRRFGRALAQLESVRAPLDVGRLLAREIAFRETWLQAPTRALTARARDALSRSGADARSMALVKADAGAAGASVMMAGQSVLARSMLGGPPAEDVELKAVFEVTQAISSVLKLEELLQRILNEVVRLLHAERGVILQQVGGEWKCLAARGIEPERAQSATGEISFSVVKEVERTGQVALADNAQLDERFRGKASVLATDIRSVLCAPLKTSKAMLGYLYLDSTIKARIFKDAHRELLSVFATQAATAMENARAFAEIEDLSRGLETKVQDRTRELAQANTALTDTLERVRNTEMKLLEAQKEAMEKEMNVAREIQQKLVPPPGFVECPGVALMGVVEPASRVGGDFWTYLNLPDDKTLILIGDVTGHGVGAGMVTTVARACCVTLLRRQGTVDVQGLLSTLSDVIVDTGGTLSMTAFSCLVDPKARQLTYALAAHNPPFMVEQAGGLPKLRPLAGPSKRLGGATGNKYVEKRIGYTPGDRIVTYTDGLVECTDAQGNAYGDRRFRAKVIETARLSLADQFAAITSDYRMHFGEHPREDDTSLVVIELR